MKRTAVVCLVALAIACTFTFALLVPSRALAAPPPGNELLAGPAPSVSTLAMQDTAQESKLQEGPADDEEKKGDEKEEKEKEDEKDEPKIKPYEEVITEEAVSDEGVFLSLLRLLHLVRSLDQHWDASPVFVLPVTNQPASAYLPLHCEYDV